jgi:alpha-N-acetylglucosaminidase
LRTPTKITCLEWDAWGSLNAAAPAIAANGTVAEPYVYDLVNTAREVLAQLSTPVLLNFSAALTDLHPSKSPSSPARINATAGLFIALLTDLDRLLATDTAFMLGPWLASARKLGGNATDCVGTRVAKLDAGTGRCDDFMDWNARAQLTSWYPTLSADASYPGQQNGRDHDYAGKQWAGLISGIYVPRAELYRAQALHDAKASVAFNSAAALKSYARMTYNWQTGFENEYPVEPVGDAVAVSIALRKKYSPYFSACQ